MPDALATTITTLPEHLRRSLTWDEGTEMALHANLKIATGLDIYFCDPHSPWQRGSNETPTDSYANTSPKAATPRHAPDELAAIAAALNGRPRKTLQWQTPAEALDGLPSHHHNPCCDTVTHS